VEETAKLILVLDAVEGEAVALFNNHNKNKRFNFSLFLNQPNILTCLQMKKVLIKKENPPRLVEFVAGINGSFTQIVIVEIIYDDLDLANQFFFGH
jgi:hypothetical protein